MSDFDGSDTGDSIMPRRHAATEPNLFDEIESAPLPRPLVPLRKPQSNNRMLEEDYLWRSWFINNTRPADILRLFTRPDGHEIRNRNYYKDRRKEMRKKYGETPHEILFNGYTIKKNEVVPEEIARNFINWLESMGGRRPNGPVGGLLPVTDGQYGSGFEGYSYALHKRTTGSGASLPVYNPIVQTESSASPKSREPSVAAPASPAAPAVPAAARIPSPLQPIPQGSDVDITALQTISGRSVEPPQQMDEPLVLQDISSDEETEVPKPVSELSGTKRATNLPPTDLTTIPLTSEGQNNPVARVQKKRRLFGPQEPYYITLGPNPLNRNSAEDVGSTNDLKLKLQNIPDTDPFAEHKRNIYQIIIFAISNFGQGGQYHPLVREALREIRECVPPGVELPYIEH